MTVDRRSIVARSLAALDDEGSIETRPIDEIKADLKALGIDPSVSIQAAHARARKRTSPADQLLAHLDEADAVSADIDALENANIEDIKNAVPEGTAASLAADAKRRAGVPSNIARLKRPNRRLWGWGGSMVGLAACLLLFFVTRPDLLDQIEPRSMENIDDVGVPTEAAALADADLDQSSKVQESLEFAEQTVIAADQAAPAAQRRQEAPAPAAPIQAQGRSMVERQSAIVRSKSLAVEETEAAPNETLKELVQTLGEGKAESRQGASIAVVTPQATPSHQPAMKPPMPSHQPKLKPSTTSRDLDTTELANAEGRPARTRVQFTDQDPNRGDRQDLMTGWGKLKALLLLDPNAAPPELKALAGNLPERRLIDRRDEAQSSLGQRPVIALMTVLRDGEEVDVVVTKKEDGNRIELLNALTEPTDSTDPGFEIIDLPRSP